MGAEYLELKAPANGYEIPNLPQLKDQEIWYAYEAQGNLIHSETYREYNKAFYEAMIGGINIEADFDAFKNTDYWEKYMLNTFQFSAAKSAAEMKMLQGYVFGKNGERVPFEQFKEIVEPIVGQFKEQWLRVEYDLAVHGAVMGQRWNDLYRDRDLFPYWVFTTRKDDRVREHHRELEGKIFKFDDPYAQQFWPPLDWNCRCEGESTDEGTPLNKNEMEKYTGDIGKGFEGNVGIDGIFPKTKSGSSYFNVLPNANKAKPEMFKEKPVAPMPKPEDALNELKKQVDSKYEDVLSKLRGATDKFKKTQEFKDLEQKIEGIKRFQYKIKDFDGKNIDKNFETLKEFINFKGNQQDLYGDGKILGSSISKEGGKITSTVLTEDAYLQRTFDIKKKSVSMDEFFLNPTISQSGKGTQIFYNQVNQFKDLGFKKLETEAGAARGMNGYYTWARVGYDIKDKNELKIFQSQMKMSGEKEFKNVKSLQELMVTKKGRDYWRKEGSYFHGEFDLTTGSNSMKILDQYIKQKNEKNKTK